jgi:hypothetical protein
MRWQRLFADLDAQFVAGQRAEREADVADLIRAERGQLALVDRLRPHLGSVLTWRLDPASGVDGALAAAVLDLGSDWVLVEAAAAGSIRRQLLVPLRSVVWIGGLSGAARVDDSQVARRMSLTVVLRGLSRDRAPVRVWTSAGQLTGTIDRVGADHLDLAVHDLDLPRRASAVREVRCVPLSAVSVYGLTDDPASG